MEADHADDLAAIDDRRLKALVFAELASAAADERARPLQGLLGRPRHPTGEELLVCADHPIQLLGVGVLQEAKLSIVIKPEAEHVLSVQHPAPRACLPGATVLHRPSDACTLHSYPGVTAIGLHGQRLGRAASRDNLRKVRNDHAQERDDGRLRPADRRGGQLRPEGLWPDDRGRFARLSAQSDGREDRAVSVCGVHAFRTRFSRRAGGPRLGPGTDGRGAPHRRRR